MKHSSRRILALLLALSLCIGMMPMSIFADDGTEPVTEPAEEKVLDLTEGSGDDSDLPEEEAKDPVIGGEEEEPAPAEDIKLDDNDLKDDDLEDVKLEDDKLDDDLEDVKLDGEKKIEEPAEEEPAEDLVKAAAVPEEEPESEEAEPIVEMAANKLMSAKAGVWYSDFHLGYFCKWK